MKLPRPPRRARITLISLAAIAAALWAAGIIAEPYIGRYVDTIAAAAVAATLILVNVILWRKTQAHMTAAWRGMREADRDWLLAQVMKTSQRVAQAETGPTPRLGDVLDLRRSRSVP